MSYSQFPPGPVNPYLIEAMVASSKKSMWTAYVLWYFVGGLGAHNFYLGRPGLAALQIAGLPFMFCMLLTAKFVVGWETIAGQIICFIGYAGIGLVILSLLVDAFMIPSRIRAHSDRLRARLEAEADWHAA